MARPLTNALVAGALRKAGLPARWTTDSRTRFPQPKRATESIGKLSVAAHIDTTTA